EAHGARSNRANADPTARQSAEFRRKPGAGRSRGHPNPCVAAADGAGATGFSHTIHSHPLRGTIAETPGRAGCRPVAADPSGVSADLSLLTLNSEVEKQIPPPQAAEDRSLRVGMTGRGRRAQQAVQLQRID